MLLDVWMDATWNLPFQLNTGIGTGITKVIILLT